ncbi:hypothetical protein AOLI_G00166790 [Acnodon oligacanthus]
MNKAQGAYAPSHGSLLHLPAITVRQPVTGRHRSRAQSEPSAEAEALITSPERRTSIHLDTSVEAPTPFIAQPAGGSERGCTPPQEADKLRQTE